MRLTRSDQLSPARRGVTLLEVLAAIFLTGVGLLALLTLFPLGALDMAEAVRDDRAAGEIRAGVVDLNESVAAVFPRLWPFVAASLANGAADPKQAAALRAGFENVAVKTEVLDATLRRYAHLVQGEDERKRLAATLTLGAVAKRKLKEIQSLLGQLANP